MSEINKEKKAVGVFYDSIAEHYGERYKTENLFSHEKYPANYFRMQTLLNRLSQSQIKSVYEVGVGQGSPLAMMYNMGYNVAGCDISPNMVDASRQTLIDAGIKNPNIQLADIEDSISFSNQLGEGFDAAIAFGVIPHVANDVLFLDNLRMIIGGKGKVFVEFRNKLFSLFTFNRLTKEFIMEDLLVGVADDIKDAMSLEIDKCVDLNAPPLPGNKNKPSYDLIRAKYHNPFELQELFEQSGFTNIKMHWYHYHPTIPKLEKSLGVRWREEAFKLEHEHSNWRGNFLCSAGIIEAEVL